jgi:hypothetical protein
MFGMDSKRENIKEEGSVSVSAPEDQSAGIPFKKYKMLNGEVVELSEEEFLGVVAVFRMLHEQSLKAKKTGSDDG